MSRDHSLALALSSTATCSSLKTYISPLGMIRSWAHLFELHFTQAVCKRVCVSVTVHAPGSLGHLVPVTEIAEHPICHMWLRWQLSSSSCFSVCGNIYTNSQGQQTITLLSNMLMDQLTPRLYTEFYLFFKSYHGLIKKKKKTVNLKQSILSYMYNSETIR